MTYTNFPDGVTSFGMPMLGGVGGIPFTGSYFFVNYAYGSDGNGVASARTATGGNVGGAPPSAPLKTLARAHELCLAGNNDVVIIMGDGGTAATQRLEETLVWSKDATHLVGMTAPTMIAQRARISTLTTATTNINPLMTVSASGCMFANFSFFQGVGEAATDEQLINITGDRNYFGNVQFGGMGHANGAARAGSYCILLADGDENTFEGCTIGLDTVARSAANASVKMTTQSQRNVFLGCLFPVYATATSPLIVDTSAVSSIDRFALFKNCTILNSGTSDLAAVVGFNASQGGFVLLDNCSAMKCTDWTASDTATVQITGPVPNGDTSGMAVASDTT